MTAPAPAATPTRTRRPLIHNRCTGCHARVCGDKHPSRPIQPGTPECAVCHDPEWLYRFGREHAGCQ